MTIADPAVSSGGTDEPRPVLPFRDLRDCAVSLSLTEVSLDEAKEIVDDAARAWREAEAAACDLALARAQFQQRLAAEDINRYEAALTQASDSAKQLGELERRKAELEEESRRAADAIRKQRHAAEAERLRQELAKVDEECEAAVAQISRERVDNHARGVEAWTAAEAKRQDEIKILDAARKEIADRLETTRQRYRELMNPFMTWHASSFLIWAGYSAIAATGAAVTFLLDKHDDKSVLSSVFAATVASMEHLRRDWSYPLVAGAIFLLLALASIVGAFWSTDWLMRRFDPRWKRGQKRSDFNLGLRANIGRRTYVQTLVAIPYVYAIGLFLAFLTYAVPPGPINDQFVGYILPTFAHSFIGSAMTLLAASIFVMYITNIFEPRIRGNANGVPKWRQAWEIGIIPAAMLVAVGFAVFGTRDRQIWGGITAFMLVGSMALAYGLVYRGMFNELRYQESVLADHGVRIEELLQPPPLPDPERDEAREITRTRAAARARRQALLDLERKRSIRRLFLSTDDQDASLVSQFEVALSAIERFFGRKVQPRPEFYREIDVEVAPEEVERRRKAEGELQRVAVDIDQTRRSVEAMAAAGRERDVAQNRKRDADERVETAEKVKAELDARLEANTAWYVLEFRRAYALGASIKPVYDTVAGRTDEAVKKARWRPPASTPAA